jgi:SAM-dependent methyltransferase
MLGFDISWSRVNAGIDWLIEKGINARLFVGDLFHIPFADNSIDVIYTSHSLEPNGGNEYAAIAELMRVARKAVILVEPNYELASEEAKIRMMEHGYVRGLRGVAEELGASIADYGLLKVCGNALNPSGVLALLKQNTEQRIASNGLAWQCPLTGSGLAEDVDIFYAKRVGIAYPVMRKIPLLRRQHAVVASKIN